MILYTLQNKLSFIPCVFSLFGVKQQTGVGRLLSMITVINLSQYFMYLIYYGPGRTRRTYVYFAKIFVISSVLEARTVLFFLPKFSQAVLNFNGAFVLPRSRTNFVKCQNCQILQFVGVNLTENVNQVNLISLFRVYAFRQKPIRFQRDLHLWL